MDRDKFVKQDETPLATKIVVVTFLAMILTIALMTFGLIIVLLFKGLLYLIL